eukprot:TRINITY_DN3262_c0_g1_i32.p1 TRINITY_DN3262_c0_g1~~TRINITY_DN3262_c0_g1_i32.p1  ORF type:complete len:178 (-),score=41.36 TRINITY_DN3262_c0_g1_i32:193-726(-)
MKKRSRTLFEKGNTTGTENSSAEEYIVEAIVAKRKHNGQIEYQLKWKGYPSSQNTWETVDKLDGCRALVEKFEEKQKKKNGTIKSGSKTKTKRRQVVEQEILRHAEDVDGIGFDHGDEILEIIGARKSEGEIQFYVHWKDKNVCTYVPASDCNVRVPQKVIEFYEKRLVFDAKELML